MKKLISLLALSTTCAVAQQQQKQPNFVILFVDDLGWADLGYQNPKFETPNINKLKNDGLNFSRAYVSTATSSPSRASLLTGKEALRCGFVRHIYGNQAPSIEFETLDSDPGHMKSRAWLPLEEITYAERLKEMGYYTMHMGKWHLGTEAYFPEKQGFDATYGTCDHGHPNSYYYPFFKPTNPFTLSKEGDYLTDVLTDGAVDFLNKYDKQQPFLLNMWYYGVHGPHIGRKDLVAKYKALGMTKTDAAYAAMVETLDNSVGRIRRALEANGLDKNTVIIFTSDQGGAFQNAHLRGGKKGGYTLCEGGTRVPFIIYAPQSKEMGTSYNRPIQTVDIYPTLVEMASGKKCKETQINGISLVPVLKGKTLKSRDLFLHRSYEDQNCAIINGNWKLIKYRSGLIELYNLKSDESETTNLVKVEPKRTKKMLNRLNKWQADATPVYLFPE